VSDRGVDALAAERPEPALQGIDQDPPLGLLHGQLIQVE
jgi:hypothetical protein